MRILAWLIWTGLLLVPVRNAAAQAAGVPGAGHGYFLLAAQDLYIRYHTDSEGNKAKPGTVMNHAALFGFDYGITDPLALYVELPYKSNVYHGMPHKHLGDDHDEKFIDDGNYHNGWGDWAVGLRYRWILDSWLITPYATVGTPTRDYPTYAHAAVGTGQDSFTLGVHTASSLPVQNLFFEGSFGYVFMEVVDHRRVNHATLTTGLSYLATPLLTLHGFVTFNKTFNGLDFPGDYPPGVDQETFYHHDQNLRNDFVNIGGGLSYQIGDRYSLFGDVGHTLWGENTHLARFIWTIGITRSF